MLNNRENFAGLRYRALSIRDKSTDTHILHTCEPLNRTANKELALETR